VLSNCPAEAAEPTTTRAMLVTRALDKDDQKLLALMTKYGRRDVEATAGQRHRPLGKRARAVYGLGDRTASRLDFYRSPIRQAPASSRL